MNRRIEKQPWAAAQKVGENTDVRVGLLNPLGTGSQPGVELWFELMADLGEALADYLK